MDTIPRKLHDVLAAGHNIWVATVAPDGTPNVSIKGSGSLIDDRHIYFADLYHKETLENLRHDPRVAIGVHDFAGKVAMQIKGHAEILDHGDLVDEMRQKLAAVGEKWQLPPVTTVIRVTVDSVVDLWPGPHAGEEEVLAGAAGDWKTYD
ncbi:MAG TPA: pyridoxamine 5'-phosphate oxidase family protein [Thermoleophilia bacterium]|nr:pyridoxamine 5'-phosphate oxidase family protein [Thermoleophilia bacterium]